MEVGENKDKEKVRITYNFGHVSLFRIFANFANKKIFSLCECDFLPSNPNVSQVVGNKQISRREKEFCLIKIKVLL